jgi:diguanylate cyclase (GGDEF)-like protein
MSVYPNWSEMIPKPAGEGASRARVPSGVHLGWIALAGLVALYLSWQLLHWIPLRRELSGDVLLLAITLYAAVAAVGAARRAGGSPRVKRAWGLVALAILAQSAGTVAQIYYEVAGAFPSPSLADPLYLSFYPLLLVGVLSFPAGRRSARQALELGLDSAIVTLGGGIVFVYFILGPSAIAARTPLETITSVAYPVGDMILLVALGTTLLRGAVAQTRRSLWLIAIAIALFAVADLIYGYIVLHGVYHGGDPIDTLYMLAFACFAAAALRQQALPAPAALAEDRTQGPHASWLPYLAIAGGVTIMIVKEYHQPFFPNMSITIIVALTFGLVVVRQILAQASVSASREQLKHQADHDPLTGLYNRRRFAEELERILRNASRYKRHGALLMLDLDDFKAINDTRGHAAGDEALKTLSQAILQRVRVGDVVARLGGDEFAVVLSEADERQALVVAEDIRTGVAARNLDPPIHITCGLVPFDEHRDLLADDALIAADIALYEAKEKGKDQVRIYHDDASAAVT